MQEVRNENNCNNWKVLSAVDEQIVMDGLGTENGK